MRALASRLKQSSRNSGEGVLRSVGISSSSENVRPYRSRT